MTKALARKWVNALRNKDGSEQMSDSDYEGLLYILAGDNPIFYCKYQMNFDEIADIVQAVYLEGALDEN